MNRLAFDSTKITCMGEVNRAVKANNNHVRLLVFFLLAVCLTLGWVYQSGKQLVINSALMVDNVKQLRVDLSQAHYLIHEGTEHTESLLDKDFILTLTAKINKSAALLHHENVQVGWLLGTIFHPYIAQISIRSLNESLETLSGYLEKNPTILNRDAQEDFVHDKLFASAEAISETIDEQVHEGVAISLEHQRNIFLALFGASFLLFTFLLLLLRRSNKIQAMALQQATRLSQALEHSGEAVIIVNTDSVIEFVNHAFCQMTGYSIEEALGKNPNIISSGKQNKPFYKNLWGTISSGRIWRGELINRKKDGSLYPAIMTIAPIFDSEGEVSHYIANQRDLSEHKALEAHVLQSQKLEAIGTLAGGIAHDFNNALTGIIGNVYLLKKYPADQEKVLNRCSAIQEICDRAAIHIKQLLSYARNNAMSMDSIELNQCVQSTCQMASSMIPATINLKCIFYDRAVYVYWNETEVQQILINLINNARHALKGIENPEITLEITIVDNNESLMRANYEMTDKKYICLSVMDNGCGISENVLSRIFEPFFTTKEAEEGTGLGLSMAYGAIKQIGGCIDVDSSVGTGTRFSIFLPIDFATENREPDFEYACDEDYKGHGELILIADDESQLLQVQKETIESFGYTVLAANDGVEAVELFQEHADKISVVILDIVMPGMSGHMAANKILEINPAMKIIFATGYDMENPLEGYSDPVKIDIPIVYKPYKAEIMSKMIFAHIHKK